MKKKINRSFFLVTTLATVLTLLLVTTVFYELFREQVAGDLKTHTRILGKMYESDAEGLLSYYTQSKEFRVTVVEPDGSVLFDTNADIGHMGNHSRRPEILQAFAEGEGAAVRRSETMAKNTYYYAVRVADGCVLRVAREADSVWVILGNSLPFVLLATVALLGLCLFFAHILTRSIVAPINEMAEHINEPGEVQIYPELQPFAETIRAQNADILRSAQLRQEFTANVSHELKTPLTSISGYAELLENGMAEPEDVRRFAGEIHRNANRLVVLINDTIRLSELDATEADRGHAAGAFERLDLYGLAASCVHTLRINAQKGQVELQLEGESAWVMGSRGMLEEVIGNLCDNGIRYNNPGGFVKVSVEEADGQVKLSVRDNGIGIPKEHQGRIFERFYRVDKSRSKRTGGTGLGLAIVKHIVTRHGGTLEVESEPGRGTEIRVILPGAREA